MIAYLTYSDENEMWYGRKLAYEIPYSQLSSKLQLNAGQLYKEYEKEGKIYRVEANMNDDQRGEVKLKSLEVHYYDFYTPLRAYTVNSKTNEVKNIYAEEKSRNVEKTGSVVVRYKTADRIEIQDAATLKLADNVVSREVVKYYVDKDGNEVVLPTVSSAGTVATGAKYDVSSLKAARIQLDNGKVYKLAANQTAVDSGVLKEGTTNITYIYELEKGDVTVKYEDASGKSLADDVKLFTQADSGKVYDTTAQKLASIKKDNKVYKFAKVKDGSAAETGKVSDVPAVVTYVYSEVSPKVDENVKNKLGTVIVKYIDDEGQKIGEVEVSKGVVVEKGTQTSYEGYPELTKVTYEATNAKYSALDAKKDSLEVDGHSYKFKGKLSKKEAAKYLDKGEVATDVEAGTLAEGTTVLVYQYDYLIDVNVPTIPNDPTTPSVDADSKVPEVPGKSYKDLDLVRDVVRKITYVYANGPHKGEKASDDVTQTARFVRNEKINRATGEVISYGNWTPERTLEKVESKNIENYEVSLKEVPELPVKHDSKIEPVVVNYTAQTAGKVTIKYLVKGTNTEVKEEITLPSNFIGESYEVEAPKAGEKVAKAGKNYLYKEHRATSDAESGTFAKDDKVVIYDYVELTTKEETHVEEIPFETEVVINKFLPKGQTNITQQGKKGSYEVYRIDTYVEGKVLEVGKEQERNRKAPVKEIIEVGTLESSTAVPPQNEVEALKTTRHLIEGTNENIADPEVGYTEHKEGVIKHGDKRYFFARTEEKDDIRTHYYAEFKDAIPGHKDNGLDDTGEVPTNEVGVLATTRHLIEGTNESVADPEVGYTEHKEGKVNFKDKEYEYVSTEEKDNIRTHYYKEVKKVVTSTPENPQNNPKDPQEHPSDPQNNPKDPQEHPSDPQNRPEDPQEHPSNPQNNPKGPQEHPSDPQNNPDHNTNAQKLKISDKALPKTSSSTSRAATLGLSLVALAGLALRRKIK